MPSNTSKTDNTDKDIVDDSNDAGKNNNNNSKISRRDFLKILGAGSIIFATGGLATRGGGGIIEWLLNNKSYARSSKALSDSNNAITPRHHIEDTSQPQGTWYLNANGFHLTATIEFDPQFGVYAGRIINENGDVEVLDNITWDNFSRIIEFRRIGDDNNFWQWYYGRVIEGVFVGRFSHNNNSSVKPSSLTFYTLHVTGWNSDYIDQKNNKGTGSAANLIVPRVYNVVLNNVYFAWLRIDLDLGNSNTFTTSYAGRLKVYAGPSGEEPEYDLEVLHWDGRNIRFRRINPNNWVQEYTGIVTGRNISGTFIASDRPGATFQWAGIRAQILGYGLTERATPEDRVDWQQRTRAQLQHLIMAQNPSPNNPPEIHILHSDLPPTSLNTLIPDTSDIPLSCLLFNNNFPLLLPFSIFNSINNPNPARDDNPSGHPQNYLLTELKFIYTIPNLFSTGFIQRKSHAFLAVPTTPPPPSSSNNSGKYPAVLAVNGHQGSAKKDMTQNSLYWYGDSFARRGFVVLAVDISHRPPGDTPLYDDKPCGDDPGAGNGPHPANKAPGFNSSDWEEDGERAWDVIHALDYLTALPMVDRSRVLIVGHSLGGEIATITCAMDQRISMAISSGFSPDLEVMDHHGSNHPCWKWVNADIHEYVDVSDFHALIAPRPLVVETGKRDETFSSFGKSFVSVGAPFASDKQVLRRTRAAFNGDAVTNLIHYLHYNEHTFHVGDLSSATNLPNDPRPFVRTPTVIEPTSPFSLDWQIDANTINTRLTLYDYIKFFLSM